MTYLTISEARDNLRRATTIILSLEADYKTAVENAADAEAVYRAQLAERFAHHRNAGDAVEAANIKARADVVVASRERDFSAGVLKLAAEKLEDARDSRRSLWRLIEWSKEHDARQHANGTGSGPAQQSFPENVPGERWP